MGGIRRANTVLGGQQCLKRKDIRKEIAKIHLMTQLLGVVELYGLEKMEP